MKISDDALALIGIGLLVLASAVVVGGLALGWVFNLVEIAHTTGFSGMLVLRVIGIFFAPVGGVLGWI